MEGFPYTQNVTKDPTRTSKCDSIYIYFAEIFNFLQIAKNKLTTIFYIE